jgi:dynein heavy chain
MDQTVKEELPEYYDMFPKENVFYVDFLRDEPEAEVNLDEPEEEEADEDFFIYEEIPSFEVVRDRIYMFINKFNTEVRGFKLDIVLFQDALIHLMIVSRIIKTQR